MAGTLYILFPDSNLEVVIILKPKLPMRRLRHSEVERLVPIFSELVERTPKLCLPDPRVTLLASANNTNF